ncbi:cytosylglucuronate decarboxylase [Streptomyces sp. NBC_00079]|uniref:cytosylglucuronate decarboxylase n=1 Tax=Streptomyces sp. NBC_00079 TaxID=2975644 RepID=UPI0032467279
MGNQVKDRQKYLFIRILEACNADCFMCEFALSRDTYRFTPEAFEELLPQAEKAGVRVIRFTGGEPLMHRDIIELVRMGTRYGMLMSLITNGLHLPRRIEELAAAGLAQIVVSLDGGSAATHDLYRRSPGTFDAAVRGLRRAIELGIVTRVNTVVGPHNYTEMPQLQRVLIDLDVHQWELSALKLSRSITYDDRENVLAVCEPLYGQDSHLVPLGKRFYGDTGHEQDAFFEHSLPPRASGPVCRVTEDVIYLDPKNGSAFPCGCLPHRKDDEGDGATATEDGRILLDAPRFRSEKEYFRLNGPSVCQGCSATASGYSDDVARHGALPLWRY